MHAEDTFTRSDLRQNKQSPKQIKQLHLSSLLLNFWTHQVFA